MAAHTRSYAGRSDGLAPTNGQVSWKLPFTGTDLGKLYFHKYDANGVDCSQLFMTMVTGDTIVRDGVTFTLTANPAPAAGGYIRFNVVSSSVNPPTALPAGATVFNIAAAPAALTAPDLLPPMGTLNLATQYEQFATAEAARRLAAGG